MSGFNFDAITGAQDSIIFRAQILALQDFALFVVGKSIEGHHVVPIQANADPDLRLLRGRGSAKQLPSQLIRSALSLK